MTFARGLSQTFVDALNQAYTQNTWWRQYADAIEKRDMFVGIRDGYLNVYFQGNSLLTLKEKDGKLHGQIHYKYLLEPRLTPPDIPISDNGAIELHDTVERRVKKKQNLAGPPGSKPIVELLFCTDLAETSTLGRIQTASKAYSGDEKTGCHHIAKANPNIIDLEIAFPGTATDTEKAVAKRVDFAALRQTTDDENPYELVFYEAKHHRNSELRTSSGSPPVLEQIARYETLIAAQRAEIETSYNRVCDNLRQLSGIPEDTRKLATAAKGRFSVCAEPRLVIFGYDGDQANGNVWRGHLLKLEPALGSHRVIARGAAKGLVRGISR